MTQYEPYQQFRTPYGQSHDEGTIEETIHRTATKRVDHSRRPGREIFTSPGRAGIIVALMAMVISAAALTFTFMSRSSAELQISQLRNQVATMSQQLQNAKTANTSTVDGLTGKVNAMAPVVNGIAVFGMVCSQDLTNANGQPAVFLFPCAQKP